MFKTAKRSLFKDQHPNGEPNITPKNRVEWADSLKKTHQLLTWTKPKYLWKG